MKYVVTLFFTLMVYGAEAQSGFSSRKETGVAVGLSGGYSSIKSVVGNYSIGAMLNHQNHISVNLEVFSKASHSDVPVIGELRMGHVFETIELYAGYGYHCASTDGYKSAGDKVNGFKPAFGVIKYFYNKPFSVSAGMSGKIFSIQLGIFGVR